MVALAYPSPYGAAMSSLGYQRIYSAIQEAPGLACERAFLDDDAERDLAAQTHPATYESHRPLEEHPVIAFSVAYEIELAGVARMLDAANVPALREERDARHPFVLGGGPLTFSNPLPLGAFCDAIVMGEAEEVIIPVLRTIESTSGAARLDALAHIPHVFVPAIHGGVLPEIAKADVSLLPAWGPIRTPHAVLSDMFLIETERGCSRTCTYCVMRRSTNGGMRLVPMETILGAIPKDARRVGLVGAAVSDHPRIAQIVDTLAGEGREVGLSSLRPDRLNDDSVGALKKAGTRTLTTAMDGPSERLRESLERRARVKHLERCAALAKKPGWMLEALFDDRPAHGDGRGHRRVCGVRVGALEDRPHRARDRSICAKRNTPLDGEPFAGISVVTDRLDRLKRGLRVAPTCAPRRRSGHGSSGCSRKAAMQKAAPWRKRHARAGRSPRSSARSRRSRWSSPAAPSPSHACDENMHVAEVCATS